MPSFACLARKNRKKSVVSFPLLTFLIFFLDRLTKEWVIWRFREGESLALVPGVLNLTRVSNTGAAFGILKGQGEVLTLLSAGFLVSFVAIWFFRTRNVRWPWALVVAGAAGNLFDRLRFGHVVDFLDFRVWPVFNLADAAICLGVFFLVWNYLSPCIRSSSK